jgi:hypothetical protein
LWVDGKLERWEKWGIGVLGNWENVGEMGCWGLMEKWKDEMLIYLCLFFLLSCYCPQPLSTVSNRFQLLSSPSIANLSKNPE